VRCCEGLYGQRRQAGINCPLQLSQVSQLAQVLCHDFSRIGAILSKQVDKIWGKILRIASAFPLSHAARPRSSGVLVLLVLLCCW
jgi:hypothetical protein